VLRTNARVFLGLGLLEGAQYPVPNRDRIREALQPRRESREFVVPEVAMPDSGRQDENIVRNRHSLPIRGIDEDASPILVHARDFSQDHRRISLLPQDTADRRADLRRRQHGRRHLVEQRLKQMVVVTIDQERADWCSSESLGGRQAPEATANDHHARHVLGHPSPGSTTSPFESNIVRTAC